MSSKGKDKRRTPAAGSSSSSDPKQVVHPPMMPRADEVAEAAADVPDPAETIAAAALATQAAVAPVATALSLEGPPAMDTTVDTAADQAKQTAERAQALFGDMGARGEAAMERGAKIVEEMNAFAKGNVEALVESSRIAAKGLESLGQDAAEFTRKSFESATGAMKSFASVKSPTELFTLQGDYLRSSFDALVAETSRSTEAMLKLAGEVAQPLSSRAAVAAEKVRAVA